ncbi:MULTISPECIES: MgtC/SapB family protein [unclassified Tychonema]|uniref:MgtC/SapB family protein n=1 Tax=unclassified Tychonema TaxID=2642144 RepID=UPI001D142F7D|nr:MULTISPECIES: MgtC/SapB family protein [unclassified Tychonema]
MFVGGMIGWDRQLRNKPAGLRTHMLLTLPCLKARGFLDQPVDLLIDVATSE